LDEQQRQCYHPLLHERKESGVLAFGIALIWLITMPFTANLAVAAQQPDLSGDWEIQEEERSYVATLDRDGNGSYTWQNGQITTTAYSDNRWQGTWRQPGNDREGGFDVMLSDDGRSAKGTWWYTRVGQQVIPPGEWGGDFTWQRLTAPP
jgi:hypothetical protein